MATHTLEKVKDDRIEVPDNEGSNSKDFTVKSQNSMSLPLDPLVSNLNFDSGSDNFTDFRASSELLPLIITNSQNGGAKPKVPKLSASSNQNLFGTSFQISPKLIKINKNIPTTFDNSSEKLFPDSPSNFEGVSGELFSFSDEEIKAGAHFDKTDETKFDPKRIEHSLLFLKQDLKELQKNKIPYFDYYQKYTADKLEMLNKQIH